MLSTIQNVKHTTCQPGSEEPPPPDPVKKEVDQPPAPSDQPAGPAPTPTPPMDPDQSQRRKQRNPKPCFAQPTTGGGSSVNGDSEEMKNGDPESPQDLSSMVKVEMIEGDLPASMF